MRTIRWILIAAMLITAVSAYAQPVPDMTASPPAGNQVVAPSLVPPLPADTAPAGVTDQPGAAVLEDGSWGIASTIDRARPGGKRVLWDLTHGVYLAYQPSGNYSSLVTTLGAHGYSVSTTATGLASVDLSQYDILVLCLGSAWTTAYTAPEVAIVSDFVASGGGLLIMGDNSGTPNSNLQPVATEFGTTLGGVGLGSPITNFSSHPIFDGISSISLTAGGALTAASPSLALAWDGSANSAVNAAGYGYGRMVGIGDISLWANDHLAEADNSDFAVSVFEWLSFSQKRVMWDLTHGAIYEPGGFYSSLVTTLGAYGYAVDTTAAGLATVDLSQYDTLVLNLSGAWDTAYTAGEVDIITSFVDAGGGLLIMGDWSGTPNSNLQPVATEFGTTLGGANVTSPIGNFSSHPIFDGVSSITLGTGGALAAAAPSLALAWDSSDRIAVNAAGYGDGRMVAIGDVDLWGNGYLDDTDNTQFAINVFDWLSSSQKRVMWDLTHGVLSDYYEPAAYYSDLATMLGAYGYAVSTTASGLASLDLSQYDALVVNLGSAYYSAYTAAEADLITGFVDAGGGLVIMGDAAEFPNSNLNPVATEFGTTLGVGALDNAISNFISHPVFDGVSSLSLGYGGQITAAAPSVLAAADGSLRGAVNVAEYGEGRMVAIGDCDTWGNGTLTLADNSQFAVNVFDWVSPARVENHAPSLSGAGYEPSDPMTYSPSTEFRFYVHYYDGDGDPPSLIRIWIGAKAYTMTLASGAPSNGIYEYRTTLPMGACNFSINTEDGRGGADSLPDTGRLPGPFLCRGRINNNAAWTGSTSVNIRVWAPGASKVFLKNNYSATFDGPFTYSPSSAAYVEVPWTLAAGNDGMRAVYVTCRTPTGRASNIFADTIVFDTPAAPLIKSFYINNRAATTSTTNVTLKLYVNCATEARFKNKYDDPWGPWTPMPQCNYGQFPWTLAAGADGTRAVYVQTRDNYGSLSAVRADTIELNTGG
jgi:uncharacterized membrane protein